MAPSPDPPSAITLKVKVPHGYLESGADEFTIASDIPVTTLVGDIRTQIQERLPTHPEPASQRLLYGGRALVDNDQSLADALNTKRDATQSVFTLHLIVRGQGEGPHRRTGSAPPSATGRVPAPAQHEAAQAQPLHGQAAHAQPPQLFPPIHNATIPNAHAMNPMMQQHMMMHNLHRMQHLQQQQLGNLGVPGQIVTPGPGAPPGGTPAGAQFGDAVARSQQQRAAMGMQGIPSHAQGTQGSTNEQRTGPTTAQVNGDHTSTNLQPQQMRQEGNFPASEQQPPSQQARQDQQAAPQQQRAPGRPVSGQGFHVTGYGPNGEQFIMNHQTFQLPQPGTMQGQALPGMPFGFPMAPPMGFPNMHQTFAHGAPQAFQHPEPPLPTHGAPHMHANRSPQQTGPSALDRARENVAEMRRALEELQNANVSEEERNARVVQLSERLGNFEAYIDPLHVHQPRSAAPSSGQQTSTNFTQRTGGAQHLSGQGFNQSAQPPHMVRSLLQDALQDRQQSLAAIIDTEQRLSSLAQLERGQQRQPLYTRTTPLGNPTLQGQLGGAMQTPSSTNAANTTCYLLSGPQGPQAILFSPQHGNFVGSLANNAGPHHQSRNTLAVTQHGNQIHETLMIGDHVVSERTLPAGATPRQLHDPAAPQPAHNQQQQQQQQQAALPNNQLAVQRQDPNANANIQAQQGQLAAAQEPMGPLQPLLNHFWLLLRIMIFAYFLLGSNLGWRRPVALGLIGLGFMLIRAGLFGNGGFLRGWWEGVMGVEGANRQQQGAPGQVGQVGEQAPAQAQQGQGAEGGAARMPTPEQVAERLLRENDGRNVQERAWWREQIRPVERVLALLIASLWPGIGEAHVRARREAEERRRNEEEVERRRLEEEEQKKKDEEEAAKASANEDGEPSAVVESTSEKDVKASAESSAVQPQEGEEKLRRRASASEHASSPD